MVPQSFVVDRTVVPADREEKVSTVGSPAPLHEERRDDVRSCRWELFGLAPGVALHNFMGRERARTMQSGRQADPAGGHGNPRSWTRYDNTVSMWVGTQGWFAPSRAYILWFLDCSFSVKCLGSTPVTINSLVNPLSSLGVGEGWGGNSLGYWCLPELGDVGLATGTRVRGVRCPGCRMGGGALTPSVLEKVQLHFVPEVPHSLHHSTGSGWGHVFCFTFAPKAVWSPWFSLESWEAVAKSGKHQGGEGCSILCSFQTPRKLWLPLKMGLVGTHCYGCVQSI